MKYGVMPKAMWLFFQGSFQRELHRVSNADAKAVMKRAAKRYREILDPIPEFEKGDRFLVNILSASMLAAVYLELPAKPTVKQVEEYYHHAMTDNAMMKLFLKKGSIFTREYTLAGGGPCCDCHYKKK